MEPAAHPDAQRHQRVVLITGGSSGIGLAAAQRFVAAGDTVVLCSRQAGRGAEVAERLRLAGGDAHFIPADLASLAGMRRLAGAFTERWERLDVAMLNAGAVYDSRLLSEDGIEATWATNHLGVFVPALLLLGPLRRAEAAQVVVTSSAVAAYAHMDWKDHGMERGYAGWRAYGRSKLANQLFVLGLAERSRGSGLGVHCFHPGLVDTGIGHRLTGAAGWVFRRLQDRYGRGSEQGADTAVWLADHPPAAELNGRYWADRRPRPMAPGARRPGAADRLWAMSWDQAGFSDVEQDEIRHHLPALAPGHAEERTQPT